MVETLSLHNENCQNLTKRMCSQQILRADKDIHHFSKIKSFCMFIFVLLILISLITEHPSNLYGNPMQFVVIYVQSN